jgi:hypothetical protein
MTLKPLRATATAIRLLEGRCKTSANVIQKENMSANSALLVKGVNWERRPWFLNKLK